MEWRVDGSKHRLDRPPSSCRSLPIQQSQFREQGLWGTLTILSLFAGTIMASPETLGSASGSLVSASSVSMEKNSMETPSLAAWNHRKGKNITMRDLSTSEFLRAERSPSRSSHARKKNRKTANGPCSLHRRSILVRNMGLGYETDEVVSFNYCSGTCTRTNYDVILSYLTQEGTIGPKRKDFVSQPCCRPTQYENFSFLDKHLVWHTVFDGSAVACGCMG
ncbi:artemin [Ahaetulla prasina]|uniref:artemin n=1 Tax=Ahaetulla prasina TaxID=499056 RepID=UPI0026483689|nr:artemin [Ahaetulla prasina]XP_058033612.1 artemin [Ahaetulla prasina]XP_058033613.1 artemin [Ahaetulla prasina]XP_058033614.1 artemin [Ahaetulla prasina]XP_058033615.1 artemin [Ahaetulla prasina]XP_058033616.1 artemin [Ahaetulla prasina]